MKRTLYLGPNSPNLPFTDPTPLILRQFPLQKNQLFKEAAAQALWDHRGHHLLLEELPQGVEWVDTLKWLYQEVPPNAFLLFPLEKLHPAHLPKNGPWVPVLKKGKPPLLQYMLLLDMAPAIQGIAVDEGFGHNEMALFLDPFTEKKGMFSLLNLVKENPFSSLDSVL